MMEEKMVAPISYSEARRTELRALGDPQAFDRWQAAISDHFRVHQLHNAGKVSDTEKRHADNAMLDAYEAWFATIPAAK
jgi:hypothetical protein